MEGEAYLGYKRSKDGKVTHDTGREARKLGPQCTSQMCKNSKVRGCNLISNEKREHIFQAFWKSMTWEQRNVYILNLIDFIPTKRPGNASSESRRKGTLIYNLKVDDKKIQVCKKMFLQTLGIKEWTVRYWLANSTEGVPSATKKSFSLSEQQNKGQSKEFLISFFTSLPKLPSHYCRRASTKLYLPKENYPKEITSEKNLLKKTSQKTYQKNLPPKEIISQEKITSQKITTQKNYL